MLRSFGENLGLGFQLIDDTLDFAQSSEKDLHLDLHNDQVNSVVMKWLEQNPEAFDSFRAQGGLFSLFESAQKSNPSGLEPFIKAVQFEAMEHFDRCERIIEKIKGHLVSEQKEIFSDRGSQLLALVELLRNRQV